MAEDGRKKVTAGCPVCGEAASTPLFQVGPRFRLDACDRCGLARSEPRLTAEELAAWYPPAYYGSENRRFLPMLEVLIGWFRSRRARAIRALVPDGRRALDIGCGRGLTLERLRAAGWEVQGVEVSDVAAHHARDVVGLPVHVGPLSRAGFARESFDAVILWHVLEHTTDPVETLRQCRELLRPGGILAVAVPNRESLQAAVTGPHWFHLDVPRHTVHFGSSSLRSLLAQVGFQVVDEGLVSVEQDLYGWVQSLLNRLGFTRNLLYEILKNTTAREDRAPFRRHPVQVIVMCLALGPVVALSVGLVLLEVVLRRGGTVELYARRGEQGE